MAYSELGFGAVVALLGFVLLISNERKGIKMKALLAIAALTVIGASVQAQNIQTSPDAQDLECTYVIAGGQSEYGPANTVRFSVNPNFVNPKNTFKPTEQQILISGMPQGSLTAFVDYKTREITLRVLKGTEAILAKGSFYNTSIVYGNALEGSNNVSASCSIKDKAPVAAAN